MLNKYVVVGELGAPFGIQGWIKMNSFTEPKHNILSYTPWYIQSCNDKNKQEWELIKPDAVREQGNKIIIKLPKWDTPESVRVYTGKKIAVERSTLPPLEKNSYYWSELEGLTVINLAGQVLGTVSYFMETGSNDVMVIRDSVSKKEQAIPYLKGTVIHEVDLAQQTITVDWELL